MLKFGLLLAVSLIFNKRTGLLSGNWNLVVCYGKAGVFEFMLCAVQFLGSCGGER